MYRSRGLRRCHLRDVRIFAVAADGTETLLPSYERALALLDLLRHEAQKAMAYRAPGGQKAGIPRLASCPPGALEFILQTIGDGR